MGFSYGKPNDLRSPCLKLIGAAAPFPLPAGRVNGQRRRAGSSAGLVHFATKLPGAIGGVVALLSAIGWRLGGPPDAPGPREPCVLFAAAPRLEHASRTDVFSSLLKLLNGLLLLAGGSAQTGAELFLERR